MNVPGLPNLPAPSPRMVDNWRYGGHHLNESWRYQSSLPKPSLPKIEPFKPILPKVEIYNPVGSLNSWDKKPFRGF